MGAPRRPTPRSGKVPPAVLRPGWPGPSAASRPQTPAGPRRREGRAPSPRRRHQHPAPASRPPPPSLSVNPLRPAARLRGGGRARGWSCRVSSRERPGRRPACLQAPGPGLAATAAAQARAARPPACPRPERRAYPEQPRAGRSLVGQGSGGDGGRGGGWKGVTAAAAGQVRPGRGLRRGGAGLRPGPRLSAPSRLRSSGRWSGRRRAGPGGGGGRAEDSSLSRPTCLAPPHPPSPTTRSGAAAARAPEAAGRAGAETTAPSLPRALPPVAPPPPPPPRARPRAGAFTTAPCCPSPTPLSAPPRGLGGRYSCGAAEQLERPGCRWAGTAARAGRRGRGSLR